MSLSGALRRGIISLALMAVLVSLLLQPRIALSPLYDLAFIVTIEAVAVGLSMWLAHGGIAQALIRTLLLAAMLAFVIVFVLGTPTGLGFDQAFLLIAAVEALGSLLAWGMGREPALKK